MGRTLHFRLTKANGFTKRDLQAIEETNNLAGKPTIAKSYVCEWFGVSSMPMYSHARTFTDRQVKTAYNKRLEQWNNDRYEAFRAMVRDGYFELFSYEDTQEILNSKIYQPKELRGFTKVTFSEHNAALVYLMLLRISKDIPDAIIYLQDERDGNCALRITRMLIRNGQTILDTEATQERLEYLLSSVALSSPIAQHIDLSGISAEQQRNLGMKDHIDPKSSVVIINQIMEQARLYQTLLDACVFRNSYDTLGGNIKRTLLEQDHEALNNPLNFLDMSQVINSILDAEEYKDIPREVSLKALMAALKPVIEHLDPQLVNTTIKSLKSQLKRVPAQESKVAEVPQEAQVPQESLEAQEAQ